MKRKIVCLLLCALTLIALMGLTGCTSGENADNNVQQSSSSLKGVEIYSKTLTVDTENKTLSGELKSGTTIFQFIGDIFVSDGAVYYLCSDVYGQNVIPTKVATLNAGNNTYYIVVVNGNDTAMYTVTLRVIPTFTVYFDTKGGTPIDSQTIVENGFVTMPNQPTKIGYTFIGWDFDFKTPITENKIISASWRANNNIPYKVEYYFENIEDNNYTIDNYLTENSVGTADTYVDAIIKEKENFTPISQSVRGIVKADGSQVLKVYYSRNKFSISVDKNGGGSIINGGTYKYGKVISLTANEYLGYAFAGWYSDNNLISSSKEFTTTVNKNLTAKFYVKSEMSIFKFTSTATTCSISEILDNTIKNLIIPSYVTSISSNAFSNCSFEYVKTPTSVIGYIPKTNLKEVEITSGTSINSSAFSGCTSLTSITIPNSVTSIGSSAFYNCSSLTSVNYTGSIDDWVQINFGGYNANPLYYAKNLYIDNKLVTEANITKATKINAYAFYNCSSFTSITIPNSVTSIGYEAFYNCSSLTSVTIPNGVTSIGDRTFYGCSSLTSIEIPNSVTSIGSSAFEGCDSLTRVNYTGSIDDWVQIDFIYGTANPLYYAKNLYIDNKLVTEANITKATKINAYAFYKCSSLTSVTIPNSVTSIGDYAFAHCDSLTSVTIPNSVTSIGDYAFIGCLKLQYNEYDNGLYLGNISNKYLVLVKAKDTSITSCQIHANCKIIYCGAFNYCSKLTSIEIPNSVTSIGDHAFENCSSLTSVTIGNGVTSIGSSAFFCCSSLTSVTFNGTKSQWQSISKGYSWKYNVPSTCKVKCIDETINI